jgi:hypothetical protein
MACRKPSLPSRFMTPRIVKPSGRSNTKPDGATETSFPLIIGSRLRNCVRIVAIVIKSFRSLTASGIAPTVAPAMTEIIMRLKTPDTKESESSLRVGHNESLNACGASVRPATAGRSRWSKNPADSSDGNVKCFTRS